jgi:hypothetical protein
MKSGFFWWFDRFFQVFDWFGPESVDFRGLGASGSQILPYFSGFKGQAGLARTADFRFIWCFIW